WVLREGEIRVEAGRLLSQLRVVYRVEEAEPAVLLRVEAVEGGRGQKCLDDVAALRPARAEGDRRGKDQRRVLLGAVDLRLGEGRLIALGAIGGRQQVELMAVPAGAMAGAGVARVDPEGDAVRQPRPADVALRRLVLAAHRDLNAKTAFVPCQADV